MSTVEYKCESLNIKMSTVGNKFESLNVTVNWCPDNCPPPPKVWVSVRFRIRVGTIVYRLIHIILRKQACYVLFITVRTSLSFTRTNLKYFFLYPCCIFQTNDKNNYALTLDFDWVVINLETSPWKSLRLFQQSDIIKKMSSNMKQLVYFETKKQTYTLRFAYLILYLKD